MMLLWSEAVVSVQKWSVLSVKMSAWLLVLTAKPENLNHILKHKECAPGLQTSSMVGTMPRSHDQSLLQPAAPVHLCSYNTGCASILSCFCSPDKCGRHTQVKHRERDTFCVPHLLLKPPLTHHTLRGHIYPPSKFSSFSPFSSSPSPSFCFLRKDFSKASISQLSLFYLVLISIWKTELKCP